MRLRLQTFSNFKGAVPFKLRLSASEWRFALTSFAVKVALFWLLELAFCKWAPERQICHLVEKGVSALPDHLCGDGFSGDPTAEASLGSLIHRARSQQRFLNINQLAWLSSQAMRQSKPQTMSSTELVIAHQASAQVRVGGTRPVFNIVQKLS